MVIGRMGSIFDIFVFVVLLGIKICNVLKLKCLIRSEKVFFGFIFVLRVSKIKV